ncbi:MAG: sulfotransferase domain-containing protein [Cyanobacteria bacterium P01_F01_bin.143]
MNYRQKWHRLSNLLKLNPLRNKIPLKNITKCLVLFHPRSGSSWLLKLLEENSNFRIGYEIFGSYQYESGSPTVFEQEKLLNNFYNSNLYRSTSTWDNNTGCWEHSSVNYNVYDTIACKISPYQIINKKSFVEFVQENQIKVICLTRQDLVRRAISEYRSDILYKKIGVHNLTQIDNSSILGSTKLEKSEFLSFLERSLLGVQDVTEMANLLVENNVDIFQLTYECLLNDTNSSLQKLEEFLDSKINIRQTDKIIKITDNNLQNSISNYRESLQWADEYLRIKG